MSPTTASEVAETTERVFALIDSGSYDVLEELMTAATAAELTRDVVLDTWAAAVGATGNLVRCTGTRLELPDGTVVTDGDAVVGNVVGHTTLECEDGAWLGRVAYDGDRRVVGLLVAPTGATDLPW